MGLPNLSNGWTTTTTGSLTNVATSVTVASTSGIPTTPFRAVLLAEGSNTDEIVTVTNNAAGTLTITRAVEANAAGSSSASAHASGATISHVLTKNSLTELAGINVNTVASSGASQTVDPATAAVWDITLTSATVALTIAGSSGLTWLSGSSPVLHSAASAVDIIVFVTQATAGQQSLTIYLHQDGTGGRLVTWANAGGGTVFYGAQASPPSLAFGSAAITAATSRTGASAAFADITGASVTLTTGPHRLRLTLAGGECGSNDSNKAIIITFSVDGTDIDPGSSGQGVWQFVTSGAAYAQQLGCGAVWVTDVLTAGSHTIKGRIGNGGLSGTARFYAAAGGPQALLIVEELPY